MTKSLADAIRKFADDCEDDRVVAAVFLKSGDLPSVQLGCAKRDGTEEGDKATECGLAVHLMQSVGDIPWRS